MSLRAESARPRPVRSSPRERPPTSAEEVEQPSPARHRRRREFRVAQRTRDRCWSTLQQRRSEGQDRRSPSGGKTRAPWRAPVQDVSLIICSRRSREGRCGTGRATDPSARGPASRPRCRPRWKRTTYLKVATPPRWLLRGLHAHRQRLTEAGVLRGVREAHPRERPRRDQVHRFTRRNRLVNRERGQGELRVVAEQAVAQ